MITAIIVALLLGTVAGASLENLHQRPLKKYIKELEQRLQQRKQP